MKGAKSPAIVNLAALVFGWIVVRLSVLSFSAGPPQLPLPKRDHLASVALATLLSKPDIPDKIDVNAPLSFLHMTGSMLHFADAQSLRSGQNNGLQLPITGQDFDVRDQEQPTETMPAKWGSTHTTRSAPQFDKVSRNWQLSGYALLRTGSGQAGIATNGQLGGSQIGLRAQRQIIRSGQFSLSASGRISAPIILEEGKEAGFGFALKRSGRVPVELIVERRVGLDRGGRNAVAALVATGFDDVHIPAKLLFSGYVQAGAVGLKSRDGFVDGALRAEHALLDFEKGGLRIGGVLAGSAQPGVSRVDLGPTIAARFRVAHTSFRVAAEWRERIGGNALPGSGPTITLGFDY
ncbi:hypothetical protein [Aquisediminimonas profunda]|uniref:hypothetical protein n=1 Tax=Aquisediminimonas profunda TaxID=1550733 RepID=UPI001C62A4C0|nr:hypothetical protein [Aquisediminimonas profunda]